MGILLADDKISLAIALVHILEKNNFSPEAVHNGEDTLTYLENGCYDTAILDVMMPNMDGIQVLKKIRENDEIPASNDAGVLLFDQFHLLQPGQPLYCQFPLKGFRMGAALFHVFQLQRTSAPGVLGALAALMHGESMGHIHCDARIKGTVTTLDDI